VIGVSVSQAFPPLGPEFEPFLFAVVCNEGNGMPLTIISAIARSGADPWKEAARIAKLPRNVALDVLSRMIPDRSGADNAAIAGRLFALLPVAREKRIIPVAVSKKVAPRWSPVVPIIIVLLLGLALVSAFRTTTHSDAGPVETRSAPTADKTDP
jgi:hypothetical protein